MAGITFEASKSGGRRTIDAEINMVPMIDLLMVTISFLLLTAVWSHMARLAATAQAPGTNVAPPCESSAEGCPPERVLHVNMRAPDRFVLDWKEGASVVRSVDVPRNALASRAPARSAELATAIRREWALSGAHREPTDRRLDRAVLHTDDVTRYAEIVAVLDALHSVQRPLATGHRVDNILAFSVALAEN